MPDFIQFLRDLWARLCGETPRTEIEQQVFTNGDRDRPNWIAFDAHLSALEQAIAKKTPSAPPDEDWRKVATHLTWILAFLDELHTGRMSDPDFLIRMGRASALGKKFDWPGCGNMALGLFKRVLDQDPDHPQANYRLGLFMAETPMLQRDSLPYLQRARAHGVTEALYVLGLVHASLGRKEDALAALNEYIDLVPSDLLALQARSAIMFDEFKVLHYPSGEKP